MKKSLYLVFLIYAHAALGQSVTDIIEQMPFRSVGPAFMTGRIADVAKDPNDPSTWYVAVASGNVWKTTNNATTWTPIFENYGSFSTGCIAVDPTTPTTIWLGTGENQSQRSASWGDGVYKSLDAGKTWQNMGLKTSEHIGRILIHPNDGQTVWVAAQGPLWSSGGERGVYKTTDGGKTWRQTLAISEHTGASEIVFHPDHPDVLYVSTYQRRRHVGILVAGGEESRIYKSLDGGESWRMLSSGLPAGDIGRISLAVSPQRPNVIYAQISKAEGKSGFYRSSDAGESWTKRSNYALVDPQYYGELYADPHRFDCVYVMDMQAQYTEDGGKTFQRVNSRNKHVDNHSLLFDPADPNYLLMGCDGGLYESFDRANTWHYHDNLPITQFYRVGLDNDFPVYRLYGGTQDNSTLGGPSRTFSRHGITNHDWELVLGGDGFQARVDPTDPNTIYAQYQYAGLVRYDRGSGQRTELQPQPGADEDPVRWHWDAPLVLSHHDPSRLYYAAQHIYRSDDRGQSWQKISGDLSRNEDRNQREVMGKLYLPEAVWKNVFTSPFGTIVSLAESELDPNLLVAGTDDGLIQISMDGGSSWSATDQFPNVSDRSYVSDIYLSQHNREVIYVTFNNHKEGDFKPYVLQSKDLGKSWSNIGDGLKSNDACWSIYEDHVDENLLFLGTEFGVYCSIDQGGNWTQMKGNLPTIAVRDIEIQQRENDLVLATFGRGFYILDNYSLLRDLSSEPDNARIFSIKNSPIYIPNGHLGYGKKGVFGDNFYNGDDVPPGACIDLYLPKKYPEAKENRSNKTYPSYETLKSEDLAAKPQVFLRVSNEDGRPLALLEVKNKAGHQRVHHLLRRQFQSVDGKVKLAGPPLPAGNYQVQLVVDDDGKLQDLGEPEPLELYYLNLSDELPAQDHYDFYSEVAQTQIDALVLSNNIRDALEEIVRRMGKFRIENPAGVQTENEKRKKLIELQYQLSGDRTLIDRFEYYSPSVLQRLRRVYGNMGSSYQITDTHRASFALAKEKLQELRRQFSSL